VVDAPLRQRIENIINSAILGYKVEVKKMEKNSINNNIEYKHIQILGIISEMNIKKYQNKDTFGKNIITCIK